MYVLYFILFYLFLILVLCYVGVLHHGSERNGISILCMSCTYSRIDN